MWKITHHAKGISRFFEETLGVKLKNTQWSYGAMDPANNRVFLKLWESEQVEDADGVKFQVYWKDGWKSNGKTERLEHIDAIRRGAKCFGVLGKFIDPKAKKVKIETFDDEQLLIIGNLEDDDDRYTYARILGRLPISELGVSTLIADFKKIESDKATGPTTKQELFNARVGQGKFGSDVREFWNHCCSVTGASTKAALEASHIKRWADSNDAQRLDPNNGLLLTANLHKLFDAGLISFDDSGQMLVSSKLSQSEQEIFGVIGKKLSKKPSAETANYLSYHRTKFLE